MYKLIEIKPLAEFKIYLKYSNGLCGEYDLTKIILKNEFKILRSEKIFNQVFIDEKTNDICWPCGINLCKDAVYKQLELKLLMKNLRIDLNKI